jgi:hypothetical protein
VTPRPSVGRLLAAIALCWLAVACEGAPTATARADTGIRGTVILGPTCAVEQETQSPCLTPLAAVLVVRSKDGSTEVGRVTSSADGRFELVLPPGEYVILPEPGENGFPVAQPQDITVRAGEFTDLEINYDSGIR